MKTNGKLMFFLAILTLVISSISCVIHDGWVLPNGREITGEELSLTQNALASELITPEVYEPETMPGLYPTDQQALIDMELVEDDNLIYGVEPKKVFCEGVYTYTNTQLVKSCSFSIPFSLEFWNVGALGGADFAGASFSWQYVDFNADCKATQLSTRTTSGSFSGGPNGHMNTTWASIQLSAGEMGSLSYSDEDETMSGSCTISNPAAFAGWTGP